MQKLSLAKWGYSAPKLKILCVLIFCTSSMYALRAQTAIIHGTISDREFGETLIGATVTHKDQDRGTLSDFDGKYELEIPVGKQTISFSYVGMVSQNLEIEVSGGEMIQHNVILDSALGKEIVFTDTKNPIDQNQSVSSIDPIPAAEMQKNNDPDLSVSLRRNPGVQVIGGQVDIRGASGFAYGAGSRVLIVVDGLPMLRGDAMYPEWDFIPMETISQVEVSKGPASALFGASALGGVVYIRSEYARSKPETRVSLSTGIYNNPRANAVNDSTNKAWWNGQYPAENNLSFVHKRKVGKLDGCITFLQQVQ